MRNFLIIGFLVLAGCEGVGDGQLSADEQSVIEAILDALESQRNDGEG